MNMTTLGQAHSKDACYFGEWPDWLIVLSRHRDSDVLEQSNFETALEMLGGEKDEHVAIERSSHWAVGWIEYLIIDPASVETVSLAKSIRDNLEDYPILDEMDYSKREYDEYLESWESWGRSDFVKAVCARISKEYPNGISEDFADYDILSAIDELSASEIDEVLQDVRNNLNWEFQSEGSGVTINIAGMVKAVDLDKLIDPAIETLWAQRKAEEIGKLGRLLGACQAEITLAVRQGIVTVTGFQQLMQDSI